MNGATDALAAQIAAVLITPRPDCMLWPSPSHMGYGRLRVDGKNVRIHRLMWEAEHGPIPDGLVVDHLCRVRSCCNTQHMELVTPEENTARAQGFPRLKGRRPGGNGGNKRASATACRNGHPYADGNFRIRSDGTRRCQTCARASELKSRPPKWLTNATP